MIASSAGSPPDPPRSIRIRTQVRAARPIAPARTGLTTSLVILAIIVVLALAVVGAMAWRGDRSEEQGSDSTELFLAKRGNFEITVPASGELTALEMVEIRNRLETRAVITEIIGEGVTVKAGDVLLKLNDEDIRNKIADAQDEVNSAENALIAANANLEIKIKEQEAALDKADLQVMLAELSLKAWQEGDAVSKRQELALAVETAQLNYDRLQERYEDSKRLQEQNFISYDELKGDEIAMIEAKAKLEKGKLEKEVYEKYTSLTDEAQKQSDLDQAIAEKDRIIQRFEAEVRQNRSEVDSKTYRLSSAKERLTKLENQLAYCTVLAPSDGLVVYASSLESRGRGDDTAPQVGTELSRNEQVIALPDTSQMVAEVKVNEALSGLVKPDQRALVIPDAASDRPLGGKVLSIGVLAESGGWRDPNRRNYTVRILLDDTDEGLKPSMRVKAKIFVEQVEDALFVPIQSLFREGRISFVYIPEGSGFHQHAVTTGRTSELFVEILDGLDEGQPVLTRKPQDNEVLSRIERRGRPEQEVAADSTEDRPSGPGRRRQG